MPIKTRGYGKVVASNLYQTLSNNFKTAQYSSFPNLVSNTAPFNFKKRFQLIFP